jgi:DNA ligase 1
MHLLVERLQVTVFVGDGAMALFAAVAALAEELAGEAGRLKKRSAIAGAISAVHAAEPGGEDAGLFAMYVAGTPFAEADARKLNAGGALLSKVLLAVSGATDVALTAAYRRHGDMGAAAFDLLSATPMMLAGRKDVGRAAHDAHRSPPHQQRLAGTPVSAMRPREDGAPGSVAELTLEDVAEAFSGMAVAKTTAIRAALVEGMLRKATPLEAKYLLKLMLGDMRIGVKQSLVEEAIAVAAGAPVEVVRRAVMLEADLAGAVRRAFAGTLGEARMRLFHPLGFMLASPVETPEEAVERFTEKPVKIVVPKAKKPKRGKNLKKEEESLRRAMELDPERETEAAVAVEAESEGFSQASVSQRVDVDAEEFHDAPVADVIAATESQSQEEAVVGTSGPRGVEAFLEDKYDGMRAQVHCGDAGQPGRVAIYSRNREDVTESFPELEEAFARVRPERDGALIFDGEILGWDLEQARALPFAVLGQRIGRKKVSNGWRQQVPVVFMAFDLMYAGGELLLELPLRERRNRLEAVVEELVERVVSPVMVDERARDSQAVLFAGVESEGVERLMISPSRLVESAEDIDRAYADARARANEGVMLKAASSVYQPGRRGLAWLKLKRELATLDVVVTGAEFGHGKRAGILSDYTFAVRGADGELLNVGKAYSGLTDLEIAEMSAWMMEHTLEDQGYFRIVEPLMVLEVAFNNIMRSGRHASGFALRFPRILRIRTDKPVSEIDTVARVEEIYQSQVDKPADSENDAVDSAG